MKKHELQRILRRQGLTYESFSLLVGVARETAIRWGADGEDVPVMPAQFARLLERSPDGTVEEMLRARGWVSRKTVAPR